MSWSGPSMQDPWLTLLATMCAVLWSEDTAKETHREMKKRTRRAREENREVRDTLWLSQSDRTSPERRMTKRMRRKHTCRSVSGGEAQLLELSTGVAC